MTDWYRIKDRATIVATAKADPDYAATLQARINELQTLNTDGIRCIISREQLDFLQSVMVEVNSP